ncbi:MAG: tRNA-dihydrouridine synthase [Bacteroidota bacterium]
MRVASTGYRLCTCCRPSRGYGAPDFKTDIKAEIKKFFAGTVITGGNVDSEEKAKSVLENGFDLVYIGRAFIANPDLVEKLQNRDDLKQPNPNLFYAAGKEGYTDY